MGVDVDVGVGAQHGPNETVAFLVGLPDTEIAAWEDDLPS
jgi:hypothetical protein